MRSVGLAVFLFEFSGIVLAYAFKDLVPRDQPGAPAFTGRFTVVLGAATVLSGFAGGGAGNESIHTIRFNVPVIPFFFLSLTPS
jgi:hypothetical protein